MSSYQPSPIIRRDDRGLKIHRRTNISNETNLPGEYTSLNRSSLMKISLLTLEHCKRARRGEGGELTITALAEA